eukprot:scaffold265144_cov32-Tisochrysis_lutea.AAC.1
MDSVCFCLVPPRLPTPFAVGSRCRFQHTRGLAAPCGRNLVIPLKGNPSASHHANHYYYDLSGANHFRLRLLRRLCVSFTHRSPISLFFTGLKVQTRFFWSSQMARNCASCPFYKPFSTRLRPLCNQKRHLQMASLSVKIRSVLCNETRGGARNLFSLLRRIRVRMVQDAECPADPILDSIIPRSRVRLQGPPTTNANPDP